MTLGVSVPSAHLDILPGPDPLNPRVRAPEEIDWDAFVEWRGGSVPRFAGRYLIGSQWQWAHGEAGTLLDRPDLGEDLRILPIQRAGADRQKATKEEGERYGTEDGYAFNDALQRCLDVGDLALVKGSVYGFLEVEDGTALSVDYWRAWCSTLARGLTVTTKRLSDGRDMPVLIQPMLPCVLCSFGRDAASGKLVVPEAVRQALNTAAPAGSLYNDTRCHGFWARAVDPAYRVPAPALDWMQFDDYQQPQPKGPVPVPVLLWRYADAPDAAHPVPEIGKLTLDATRAPAGQPDGVLDAALVAKEWSATARPIELGVDKGGDISTEIRCLARNNVTISHLPEGIDRPHPQPDTPPGPTLNPKLKKPVSFVVRYYSTGRLDDEIRRKDLKPGERGAIAREGARLVSIWQGLGFFGEDIYNHLTTPGAGKEDARNAFAFAANKAGQPAHTPVYFSVDSNVTKVERPPPRPPGQFPTVSFEQIVAYFTDIQDGYSAYLADQVAAGFDPVPYRVGVYSSYTVFDALYTRGLATHFWQAYPPGWGDAGPEGNKKPWPHANMWQVLMDVAGSFLEASGILGCRKIFEWVIYINNVARAGDWRLLVGQAPAVETTDPIAFDAGVPQVRAALRALPTWGPRSDVEFLPPTDDARRFRLIFNGNPHAVAVDDSGLDVGGHLVEKRPGFVDVNVSWGNEGGWRP
jgi:hypothetical protein